MEVNRAFLNGYKKEEVYIKYCPCFEREELSYYVYKLEKVFHGLRQAPRSLYESVRNMPIFMKTNSLVNVFFV